MNFRRSYSPDRSAFCVPWCRAQPSARREREDAGLKSHSCGSAQNSIKGRDSSTIITSDPITRRHILQVTAAASGGLLIGFYLPESEAASIQPKPWTALPQGAEINAWLAIDSDGNVTIRVPHTEMGQGALTSVSMMIAEELNVHWTRVRAVFADPNRHLRNNNGYTTMFTAGSALVRRQHPHIM